MLKVGDLLYYYDYNAYSRLPNPDGLPSKWAKYTITGETRISWVAKRYGREIKIDKATLTERNGSTSGYGPKVFVSSLEQVMQSEVLSNSHIIGERVARCKNYAMLVKILDILDGVDEVVKNGNT